MNVYSSVLIDLAISFAHIFALFWFWIILGLGLAACLAIIVGPFTLCYIFCGDDAKKAEDAPWGELDFEVNIQDASIPLSDMTTDGDPTMGDESRIISDFAGEIQSPPTEKDLHPKITFTDRRAVTPESGNDTSSGFSNLNQQDPLLG